MDQINLTVSASLVKKKKKKSKKDYNFFKLIEICLQDFHVLLILL